MQNADTAWLEMLDALLASKQVVSPRGQRVRELLSWTSAVNMKRPVVTCPPRRLGYRFMAAEAAWILSGDNRVETIRPYSKAIAQFSDDGVTYFGAYGPRIVDQLNHVARTLHADPESRQAVLTIWRPNPPQTRDVPCTVSVQFLMRNRELHCVDTMRGSDAWLGWPYDVFNFSMLSAYVLLYLRELEPSWNEVDLGLLYLTAGSQHLYERNLEGARDCVALDAPEANWDPGDVHWQGFKGPSTLVNYLWQLADDKGVCHGCFDDK